MPLSDIILGSGQLLITPLSSASVAINFGQPNLSYGTVRLVNQLSDQYQIGQKVLYNNVGQISVTYAATSYFIISESSIKLVSP